MTDRYVMMLTEVSAGLGSAEGDEIMEHVVDEMDMLGCEGVTGEMGKPWA